MKYSLFFLFFFGLSVASANADTIRADCVALIDFYLDKMKMGKFDKASPETIKSSQSSDPKSEDDTLKSVL